MVAWLLGHDPSRRVIVVSYANELAAELHRQFRMIIDASWYRALFPAMRPARDSGSELVTTAGGGRYATSVGGTLTGRGADLIVIDDPLKAEEAMSEAARKRVIDWYAGTLVSRLNDKEHGPIVVVMQRLHENDLAGHLLVQGGWEHLDLPAIAVDDTVVPLGRGKIMTRRIGDILHPERESKDALDRTKAEIGSLMFSAQYQQRPIPLEGNLIRRGWFRFYDALPGQANKRIVQSWDIATMTGDTNDYSVCTTWLMTKHDYYLVDVFRVRLEYPALRRKVASLAAEHGAGTVLIEDAGAGMQLLQDLRHDLPHGMPRPIGRRPEGSKADRMVAQSAKIEAGHIYLPRRRRLARQLPPRIASVSEWATRRPGRQCLAVPELGFSAEFPRWKHATRCRPKSVLRRSSNYLRFYPVKQISIHRSAPPPPVEKAVAVIKNSRFLSVGQAGQVEIPPAAKIVGHGHFDYHAARS